MADEQPNHANSNPDDLEENEEWFEVEGGNICMHNISNPGSVSVVDDNDASEVQLLFG
jgi:hypothetical protein